MPRPTRLDPFELVLRISREPSAGLLDRLRAIHRGEAESTESFGHQRPDPEAPESAPTFPVEVEPSDTSETLYDRARRHFHRHEDRMRAQARLSDQILRQLRKGAEDPGGDPPSQQELRLHAAARGRAAGRFQVENELPRTAVIELLPRPFRGLGFEWCEALTMVSTPERIELEPGAQCSTRVEISLAECPARAGDRLEGAVDVFADGERVQRLWITISVHGEDEP